MGIPGKSAWPPDAAKLLAGVSVFLWMEPDAEDLVGKVTRDIPGLKVIVAPSGIKDLSEAHMQGLDISQEIEKWKAAAVPAATIPQSRTNSRRVHPAVTSPTPSPTDGHLGRVGHLIPTLTPVSIRASDVSPEAVHWVWENYVPLGKLTIIDGDPGLGKSLATTDLAARVSSNALMPDGPSAPPHII